MLPSNDKNKVQKENIKKEFIDEAYNIGYVHYNDRHPVNRTESTPGLTNHTLGTVIIDGVKKY